MSRNRLTALLALQSVERTFERHEHAKPLDVAKAQLITLWNNDFGEHFSEEVAKLEPTLSRRKGEGLQQFLAADHEILRYEFANLKPESSNDS